MTKRKPRPGSKPLPKFDISEPAITDENLPDVLRKIAAFTPEMPAWMTEEGRKRREQAERDANLTALGKARAKVEELAGDVRSDAFNDWVERCVVSAQEPSEWTQARVLYENYLEHAKGYGKNRMQKALSIQEAATETQWGRMMATMLTKKRRTAGWYYPLRFKRGT